MFKTDLTQHSGRFVPKTTSNAHQSQTGSFPSPPDRQSLYSSDNYKRSCPADEEEKRGYSPGMQFHPSQEVQSLSPPVKNLLLPGGQSRNGSDTHAFNYLSHNPKVAAVQRQRELLMNQLRQEHDMRSQSDYFDRLRQPYGVKSDNSGGLPLSAHAQYTGEFVMTDPRHNERDRDGYFQ